MQARGVMSEKVNTGEEEILEEEMMPEEEASENLVFDLNLSRVSFWSCLDP